MWRSNIFLHKGKGYKAGDPVTVTYTGRVSGYSNTGYLKVEVDEPGLAGKWIAAVPSTAEVERKLPEWWPPKEGDVVVDDEGYVYHYWFDAFARKIVWKRKGNPSTRNTEDLPGEKLVIRGGKYVG